MKNTYLLSLLVVLLFTTSCSKDDEDFGYASTSIVGKTIKLGDRDVYWSFISNSNCTLNFSSTMQVLYTIEVIGVPKYSYKVTGHNKASLSVSYKYRKYNNRLHWDYTITHSYNLILTYTDAGIGIASGSLEYTMYNAEDDETSNGVTVISNEAFVVTDSK